MQLTFSLYSIAGLLIALGAGLVTFGIYQRWIYPEMRASHEKAKVTGRHGRDPGLLRNLLRLLLLVVLPALGFVFGDLMLGSLWK